jgi:outer membrane autotransporter protein
MYASTQKQSLSILSLTALFLAAFSGPGFLTAVAAQENPVTLTDGTESTGTVDTNGQSVTWTNSITGTGSLAVTSSTGSGFLMLAGTNSYSGGTALEVGTLNLANNSALGLGILTMENNVTLQAGINNLAVTNTVFFTGAETIDTNGYNASIGMILGWSPACIMTKTGSGALTLSAGNHYNGGTYLLGGTLVAANSGAFGGGPVVVNSGTLAVTGDLTVNVNENYNQASLGTLQLGLASPNQYDSLNVLGTATVAGSLVLVPDTGVHTAAGQTFNLVFAENGLNGQFANITDDLSEPVSVSYTANEVQLETLSFAQLGTTLNQRVVGQALDNLSLQSEDSSLTNLLANMPLSSLPSAYNQLSPAALVPIFSMGFSNAVAETGLIQQRLASIEGGSNFDSRDTAWGGSGVMFAGNLPAMDEAQIAQSVQPDRWGVFATGMGDFGTVNSDGNAAGYQTSAGGTMAGLDYRFGQDLTGGLLLGYDQSGSTQSAGTVSVTGGQAGFYLGLKEDDLHMDVMVDGGLDNYSTQRQAMGGTATGTTSGLEYTGAVNLGYDLKADDLTVSPFVSAQYTQVNVNGFTEKGSLAPLTYANQSQAYLASDLGAAVSRAWNMDGVTFSPSVSAAWEHVYKGNVDSLTANFGTGSSFTVNGPATGTDAAVIGAGMNVGFDKGLNLYASYQAKVGMANYSEESVNGGIKIGF